MTRASPPTGNLRSRLNRDLSSPDDPLTPSRAWFARSALARSRADSDAVRPRGRGGGGRRGGVSARLRSLRRWRARSARAPPRAPPRAPRTSPPRARRPPSRTCARRWRLPFRFPVRRFRRARRDSETRTRARNGAPARLRSRPRRPADAARAARRDGRLRAYEGGLRSPQDPFHAFANAATRTRTRTRDENEQKNIGGASHSASAA